jgi:hypothetical protein
MIYRTYGIYKKDTGMIRAILDCSERNLAGSLEADEDAAPFDGDQSLFYRDVENNEWVAKTESPMALDNMNPVTGDVVTLSGIPAPCYVKVDYDLMYFEDEEVELVFNVPGQHTISLQVAQYLYQEISFDVGIGS